jgi:flagellar basal-body rod modification protein FlgD
MSTAPITAATDGGATLSTSGTTLATSNDNLGENDFLQLMMDQLENQNPLSPDDPTQYLSELASFSSLEQESNIASSTSSTASEQSSASALAMIGHTVTYTGTDGTSESGVVSSVQFGSSGPTLTVGSRSGIALGSVTQAS